MRTLAALTIILFALALFAAPAAAQEPGPTPHPDEVNAIAKNLYCPVCANIPLDACGTAACVQWREQIATLLTDGYTEQQIYDYFVAQYGPSVLSAPPPSGFSWLLYVLPPLALLAGGVLLWRGLTVARKQPAARKPAMPKNKYTAELERELKERQQ